MSSEWWKDKKSQNRSTTSKSPKRVEFAKSIDKNENPSPCHRKLSVSSWDIVSSDRAILDWAFVLNELPCVDDYLLVSKRYESADIYLAPMKEDKPFKATESGGMVKDN